MRRKKMFFLTGIGEVKRGDNNKKRLFRKQKQPFYYIGDFRLFLDNHFFHGTAVLAVDIEVINTLSITGEVDGTHHFTGGSHL